MKEPRGIRIRRGIATICAIAAAPLGMFLGVKIECSLTDPTGYEGCIPIIGMFVGAILVPVAVFFLIAPPRRQRL